MITGMIIGFILMIAVTGAVIFAAMKLFGNQQRVFESRLREEMKLHQEHFLQLSRQQFELEQNKARGELDVRKQSLESSINGLKEELEKYKVIIHDFEQDRVRKYGNLENELKNASQATLKLQETTTHLNNILGNVKLRGQWGERMAEDIIRYAGLIEGVNYRKQTQLQTVTTKPDYTFFLPDNHSINMDVKFPLDNYVSLMNSQEEADRQRFQKDFVRNVKDRIKEIQNRDYINPAEQTLDFVILFIPNEQVYCFIQEQIPDVMDSALKQKVVLCSPFTLYAMLCVIRQAFENFSYEKDMKKIILLFEQFTKHYERFKVRFESIGQAIAKLEQQYADVNEKSFKQLDTKIRHIDEYKKGHNLTTADAGLEYIDVTESDNG